MFVGEVKLGVPSIFGGSEVKPSRRDTGGQEEVEV
jgi:hypothetical protein